MGGGASSGTFGLDVQGLDPAPGSNWWASLALNGKLYGIPCNAEHLLVHDPSASSSARAATLVDTRRVAQGRGKWRAAVALGGKIYGIPDRADQLLVYDVATGIATGVDTRKVVARGDFKWEAAVALAGKVYGIPHHADKILVYDPATRQASGISVGHIATGPAKWFAGIALDGKLYGIPCSAAAILVYDPSTGRASGIDVGSIATGQLKWLAATAVRGKLYGIPCHADCILAFDPATGKVSSVDTAAIATGPGKWVTAVVHNGRIYGIPDQADKLLIFDPATGERSGVDVSGIASEPGKWQAAVVLGGKIYAVPYNAEALLVFDPATREVSGVSTSKIASGRSKWSTAAVLGSRVLGLPYDARQLLVHEPPARETVKGVAEDLPAGPGQELLEDFVAAWLSEWIYGVGDIALPCPVPPLGIEGEAVEFQVHGVCEDCVQGSPARFGVVTAALPGRGKALFLVFKGSSFLADFVVNASVCPDYTPFHQAFGDNRTFVHHGAQHAIAQLRVHQWEVLLSQLDAALANGATRMLVTGHSLGGQYALAFLLHVFIDRAVPSGDGLLHPLLATLRAATFGAPMCFGSAEGAEVRPDFAEFVHTCSVNYVNGGDPAPRLWSELELEGFMRYFAGWVQGQISGFSSRLVDYAAGPGGLAKRAQELLERPDIDAHLVRPAARYLHLSRIRVLGREFRPWRPLSQDAMRMEDHSLIEAYIPAFRAAFDPSAPGHVFDEEGRSLVTA